MRKVTSPHQAFTLSYFWRLIRFELNENMPCARVIHFVLEHVYGQNISEMTHALQGPWRLLQCTCPHIQQVCPCDAELLDKDLSPGL